MKPEENEKSQLFFSLDQNWIMKISENKIYFNRDKFPDFSENDFAERVIKILEDTVLKPNWS